MQIQLPFGLLAIVLSFLAATSLHAQTFTAQLLAAGTGGTFPGVPGTIQGVAVSGSYAYLAHTYYGLMIVDIRDPSRPLPIGVGYPNFSGSGIAVSDNRVYLTGGDKGVFIFDITNAGLPYPLGQFT